jgi:hypothetical protein
MIKKAVAREAVREQIPVADKCPNLFAKLVLEAMDRKYFRDGRILEYADPLSSGLVRIQKDANGRVHFRTPRISEASIRLNPSKNSLLFKDNVKALEDFLKKNPLILSFLDEELLRNARR